MQDTMSNYPDPYMTIHINIKHIYIYMGTYIYIYIYMCIYIYMYVYVCMCVYIYIWVIDITGI